MGDNDCALCRQPGGDLLWETELCRVVRVTDPEAVDFPGFCRVVVSRHVAEMTDLPSGEAARVMNVVLATERAVRRVVRPDKVNLASLGNVVPHLHWHVIPRWHDDICFPAPIWAAPRRPGARREQPASASLRDALRAELNHPVHSP